MLLRQGDAELAERAIERVASLDPIAAEVMSRRLDFLRNPTPHKFRYDYTFEDPGYREWTREGEEWEEKPPTTGTKSFITKGRESVDGRSGTVVTQKGQSTFEVFVSDRGVADPRIYFRNAGGKWTPVGKMEDIE